MNTRSVIALVGKPEGEFKVVQLKTNATTTLVVRNKVGRKLFDMRVPDGVTIAITTPPDAVIKVEPDERRR